MYVLDTADYPITAVQLTFSPSMDTNRVLVPIINDDIHEDSEIFFGNLIDISGHPAILFPAEAVVTIRDDNDCKISCWTTNVGCFNFQILLL